MYYVFNGVNAMKAHQQYRLQFSEKLMDLGNLTAGALIFGQFLSGKEFSLSLFLVGIGLMVSCYTISFLIINRKEASWNR
ncbi:MAG: hypothetical protein Q8L37_02655 [Candidatus Gottesmanbacteria bacterium]|nr:hypothetical protein [Candidatus Gottesmanbacteria bacterium]